MEPQESWFPSSESPRKEGHPCSGEPFSKVRSQGFNCQNVLHFTQWVSCTQHVYLFPTDIWHLIECMSRWKPGTKVIGSVGYFTPIIYPIYKYSRWNNSLILTSDPSFQLDIQVSHEKNPGCLGRGWNTAQVGIWGLFHKPWNTDPVIQQPVFNGK